MTRYTLLFCGAALAAIGTGAFAGEDSTERWHSFGPAWYEVEGGLPRFAAEDPDEANPRAETAREAARNIASSKRRAMQNRAGTLAGHGNANEVAKPGI